MTDRQGFYPFVRSSATPRERFNFLALLALIISTTGVEFAGPAFIGLTLSIFCLVLISRFGGRGKALAVVATVIGAGTCLLWCAGLLFRLPITWW